MWDVVKANCLNKILINPISWACFKRWYLRRIIDNELNLTY